jgi:hypothetical protein
MTNINVIDVARTLNFVNDYNNNTNANVLTVNNGGVLTLFNTTQSQSSSIGALILQNGGLSINTLTNATSIQNGGALTVAGGAAIGGDLIVGGSIISSNAGTSTSDSLILTSTNQSANLSSGSLVTFGGISIKTSRDATSITSGGGLTIAGGAAVGSNFYVGGTSFLPIIISTNISTSSLNSTNITVNNSLLTNITSNTINVTGITSQNINFTGSLYQNGSLYTASQFTSFGNNISYTKGNVGINTTSPIYLLDINGSLRVSGTNGTLNFISSNTTTDILQLQNTNASGSSSLQFLNNSSVNKATFGFGNANTVSLQNTMYLSAGVGTPINFIAGNNTNNPFILNASDNSVSITSTTTAIDTSSGSLKVSGGVSIRGDLYIGGAVNFNSPLTVNINNTTYSSNSTTGAMKLIGGLSISVSDTTNSNATSYTRGGGITLKGGLAISQDTFIGGILDIQSGTNNLNPIKLQSLQISSNYNNGASTVIQSGDSARTSTSFTPILFSGYNDQSNPKLSINASSIVTSNSLTAINNSNTLGNLFTTGGNIGINITTPLYTVDVNGTLRVNSGNTLFNKLITLFDNSPSDSPIGSTNFYGFGINNGNFRYQVPSGAQHSFFSGSTSSLLISTTLVTIPITTNINASTKITNTTASSIGTLHVSGPGSTSFNPSTFTTGQLASFYGPGGPGNISNIDFSTFSPINSLPSVRFSMLDLGSANSTFNILTKNAGGSASTMGSRIMIDGTGNIGINTTSPSFRLDVDGSIRSSSLVLTNTSDASSASNGSFVTAGGAGIAKSVNVGGSVVINNVSSMSSGTFSAPNTIVTNGSITGLVFAPATYRSFSIIMSASVTRTTGGNYNAQYTIEGIQRDSGWNIYTSSLGDTIDLIFSINTSTGQLQYSSSTIYTNWTSTVLNYQTTVIYIAGGFNTFNLPSGAQTINGILNITDSTDSANTSTGALIVNGGVGIQKNLTVGGNIQFTGGIVKTQFYSSQNGDYTGIEITNSSSTLSNAASIVFTPVDTNGKTSQIICQCFYRWRSSGNGNDSFTIQLQDNNSNILDYSSPTYFSSGGGGGRETAKPLMGYISTTTTTNLTFNLLFGRLVADDFNYIDLTYTKFLIQQIIL